MIILATEILTHPNKQHSSTAMKYLQRKSCRTLFSLSILTAACMLMFSGCDDTESSDGVDATSVEDIEPDVGQQYNFALPENWNRITEGDYEQYDVRKSPEGDAVFEGATDEELASFVEGYAKCDLATDENEMVRVRCADGLVIGAVNPCPRGRYTYTGQLPLDVQGSDWSYCLEEAYVAPLLPCPADICRDGRVCEGALRWDSEGEPDAYCVSAQRCLAVVMAESFDGLPACFYGDLTVAVTGELPEQNCDTLAEGECAANCGCTGGERCTFLSEEHPVGVCGQALCEGQTDQYCAGLYQSSCMHLIDPPDWVSSIDERMNEGAVATGYCVAPTRCEALQSRYPGVFNCEYGDD